MPFAEDTGKAEEDEKHDDHSPPAAGRSVWGGSALDKPALEPAVFVTSSPECIDKLDSLPVRDVVI